MNWLLIRGLSREQRHWNDFPALLAREVPGAKVFSLDLPGIGTENRRTSPTSVAGIVNDLRTRWLSLRSTQPSSEPWYAFSISLGGMIAMHWAANFPEDFAGIVLTNSSAGGLSLPWERMDLAVVPGVVRGAFEKDPVARERGVIAMTTRMRTDVDELASQWSEFALDRPPARSAVARQLIAAIRFRVPPAIKTPILVLASRLDGFTESTCSQRIASHFSAPIRVHAQAGHDLTTDDPRWAVDQINQWLASRSSARRSV